MKSLIICCLLSFSALGQNVARVDSGAINGANYRILFPPGWKGKLMMYAHGYEFVATPRQSQNPGFAKSMASFLDRGFAVAASDYQYQGFALTQGVDDTEALRSYFVKKYGKPDTTFIAGHSMGGGVTLATLENFGQNYQGGLPMCPMSTQPYLQFRRAFDLYATFNGLFPGVATPLSDIFDLSKPDPSLDIRSMFLKSKEMKKALVTKDSLLAVSFAKHFDLKLDDLPMTLLFFGNMLRDLAKKQGGNPIDNINTLYSGFANDLEVNKKAERLAATASTDKLFKKYDRTGKIDKPTLLMHTLYDQLIPPKYGVDYFENMVHQQGRDEYFTVLYTNGQGHCNFTPQQTSEAFDRLRTWVKTEKKAKAGYIE